MKKFRKLLVGLDTALSQTERREPEVEWEPVRSLSQLREGTRIRTKKQPVTNQKHAKLAMYLNKEAGVLAKLPGPRLVRLRFDDGSVQVWDFEDLLVHPAHAAPISPLPTPSPFTADEITPQFRFNADGTGIGHEVSSATASPSPSEPPPKHEVVELNDGESDLGQEDDPVAVALRSGEWKEGVDAVNKRKYWWNTATREATWDLRRRLSKDESPAEDQEQQAIVHYPARLLVTPKHHPCAGNYVKQPQSTNGYPIWANIQKNMYLFSTPGGYWAFTDSVAHFEVEEEELWGVPAVIMGGTRHHGKPPHSEDTWKGGEGRYIQSLSVEESPAEAAFFLIDTFYKLHAPRHAGKAGVLVKSILEGGASLAAVVSRLCQNHRVYEKDWLGNPPKALVRYRVSQFAKVAGLGNASWNQVDVVAARVNTPAELDAEVIKICRKYKADPRPWIGAYPAALRHPTISEQAFRARVEALRAATGASAAVIDVAAAVERVFEGGERPDAVITALCVDTGVENFTDWTKPVPPGLVQWIIQRFFETYDPDGRGGEIRPIADAVSNGKYSLDEVMISLCAKWGDRGARPEDWTGPFPKAMTRAPPSPPRTPTPDLKQAISAHHSKLLAFAAAHDTRLSQLVPSPQEHIERALRVCETPEAVDSYTSQVLERYMEDLKLPEEERERWRRGSVPPTPSLPQAKTPRSVRFASPLSEEAALFRLCLFHDTHRLDPKEIPAMLRDVAKASDPLKTLDTTLQSLCPPEHPLDDEWFGENPAAPIRHRIVTFFNKHDPFSKNRVPELVKQARDTSVDAVMRSLCGGYGVDPEGWTGAYPSCLRKRRWQAWAAGASALSSSSGSSSVSTAPPPPSSPRLTIGRDGSIRTNADVSLREHFELVRQHFTRHPQRM